MFKCESKLLFGHFSGIGQPYRNSRLLSESFVMTPGGRGHFGTASFFYEAQKANVHGVEEKTTEPRATRVVECKASHKLSTMV